MKRHGGLRRGVHRVRREVFRVAAAALRLGKIRKSGTGEEGGSLIEFALVLPMMLTVMTGILTFGLTMNTYVELTQAVSTGARVLAVSRGQTTDPCSLGSTAINNAASNLTSSNFTYTFVLNGTSYSGTTCSSSSTTTGAAGNLVQGGTAKVTITYPCNLDIYNKNYMPGCTMTASMTEVVQ